MFRILSLLIIAAVIYWLFNFGKKNGFSIKTLLNNLISAVINSVKKISEFKNQALSEKINSIKKLLYVVTVALFLIMAISAFIPAIIFGGSLSGVFLLIHVTAAPFFAVSLALTIVIYAQQNKFGTKDFKNQTDFNNLNSLKLNNSGNQKLIFWLFTFFSLPAIVSIILSMFPLFGTEGQNILLEIHRYSTLILFILLVLHSGLLNLKSN